MNPTEQFEAERPRLVRIAAGVLDDRAEGEDMVQQAWLRFDAVDARIENIPAWLTVVTTRLCLDRLRSRVPEPTATVPETGTGTIPDPAEGVVEAAAVGVALQVVLRALSPSERVAFILHDTFGIDFRTIAAVLTVSPEAARKLASRARGRISSLAPDGTPADWEVVDAFLAASRGGSFARLVHLLAPEVVVRADADAIAAGTPARLEGRDAVAAMFDGAATTAFPVFVEGRPGAAWFHRGKARVAFDFTTTGGVVSAITFRASPDVLGSLVRRVAADRR
ncbi:sigma factor [Arthrobacter sp. Ld5]|uniref:sigma factor n=1 Tax=Arthrobacter sp. Ld5 TaxID=649152 RepID=UPI003EC0C413